MSDETLVERLAKRWGGRAGLSTSPKWDEALARWWLNVIAAEMDEHAATCTMEHFAREYRAGASWLRTEAER